MKRIDVYNAIKVAYSYNYYTEDWDYVAVRQDDRDLDVGFVFDNSKHNPDRFDERDFPQFGSDEYENLPEIDGTSCWYCSEFYDLATKDPYGEFSQWHDHLYVVVSNESGYHDDPDHNETVLRSPVIVKKIF